MIERILAYALALGTRDVTVIARAMNVPGRPVTLKDVTTCIDQHRPQWNALIWRKP